MFSFSVKAIFSSKFFSPSSSVHSRLCIACRRNTAGLVHKKETIRKKLELINVKKIKNSFQTKSATINNSLGGESYVLEWHQFIQSLLFSSLSVHLLVSSAAFYELLQICQYLHRSICCKSTGRWLQVIISYTDKRSISKYKQTQRTWIDFTFRTALQYPVHFGYSSSVTTQLFIFLGLLYPGKWLHSTLQNQ